MRIGTKVKFKRRNGQVVQGKVSSKPRQLTNGEWIDVNIGDAKAPLIISTRLSMLTAV